MARQLESFPASSGARYPWDEWLDGSVWELVKGEDFTSKLPTFRANAQLQARKRSGRVRSKGTESGGREAVVIQFHRT
jgi:hypothetical protein